MEKTVKSPFTGGTARLRQERVTLPYKGQEYEVLRSYYECDETRERFTSPAQHDLVVLQLREQHKNRALTGTLEQAVKHSIVHIGQALVGAVVSSEVKQASDAYSHWKQSANRSLQTAG